MSEPSPIDDDAPLSSEGQRRRAQILAKAQDAARKRRRARQRRTVSVAILLAAGVLSFVQLRSSVNAPETLITVAPRDKPQPTPVPREIVVIQRIETDPTLTRQLAISTQPGGWEKLSDDALLDQLAQAGHPAGLVWSHDKPAILFRANARP